jgi:uncharacterized protein
MHARPASDSERIRSLDVLRGFAMLGILIMNVQAFAMPEAAYINPTAYGSLVGANGWVWFLSHVLADRKFMTIFSMLFGAGILLFTRRAEARGDSPTRLHVRRMSWLVVFGVLHAYLLWYGDILVAYALCGLLVYPLRRWRPARRLMLGLAVMAAGSVLAVAEGRAILEGSASERTEFVAENWLPPTTYVEEEVNAYRGDWGDQMAERVPVTWALETDYFLHAELWRVAGLMLIGMSLFEWGIFSGRKSTRFNRGLVLAGIGVGLPLTLLGVYLNEAHRWSADYSLFFGGMLNEWASLPLAMAWIGLVMLALGARRLACVTRPLEAVGRMAFSNYILETVLCSALFYGTGFGLFGRVDRVGQFLIVLGIWLVVIVISTAWLGALRFGPLEWLWRTLTYGRAPTWRKHRAVASVGLHVG